MNPVVTGIGGAFIDLTFNVDDSTLAELCVPKGGISFVDAVTQERLIAANLNSLRDITPGGSAANSVYATQLAGVQSAFAGKVGGDDYGSIFTQSLTNVGALIATKQSPGSTNSVLAFVTPDGEKSFVVHPALAASLNFADIDRSLLKASRWILLEAQLFEYGAESRAAALSSIAFARDHGVKLTLNLGSVSVVEQTGGLIRELLDDKRVDLVIGNRDEFSMLYPGTPTDTVLEELARKVEYAVCTEGEKGALARHRSQLAQTPETPPVPVINTSGAGDSFLGTLLAGITRGRDLQNAMDAAHAVASLVVRHIGARLTRLPGNIIEALEETR